MKVKVSINGTWDEVRSGKDLWGTIERVAGPQPMEIWVERQNEMIGLFSDADRAWLIYLKGDEICFRSHNDEASNGERLIAYCLPDGQSESCPCTWMVRREEAVQAAADFIDRGGRPEAIAWRDATDSYPGHQADAAAAKHGAKSRSRH